MKRLTCIAAFLLLASAAAFADIARPQPAPSKAPKTKPAASVDTRMDIRLDRNATEARLIIPRSDLKHLRAALEQLDDDSGSTAEVEPYTNRTQTIMSGIFLSLALVFGGMWFVRSGKAATKTGKGLVAIAVVAGLASATTYIFANIGPPPEARSITGKIFSPAIHQYGFGGGQIKLEASNDETVKLIVPNPDDK